jgi:hypothetical protein
MSSELAEKYKNKMDEIYHDESVKTAARKKTIVEESKVEISKQEKQILSDYTHCKDKEFAEIQEKKKELFTSVPELTDKLIEKLTN